MRKWFTALALLLAFASNAQEPDLYSVFKDIRAGLLHNTSPSFYLDCTPLSQFKLMGDALFIQRDSINKYLDSEEQFFLHSFINIPGYRYEEYRTMDTSFTYMPLAAFDATKLTGAICANDSIRAKIFRSNSFVPQQEGVLGVKERAAHLEKLKLIEKNWDNEIYSFSAPLFSPGRTVFLLSASYTKGMFGGGGKTCLYKKINGQWRLIMWLSTYATG